MFSHSVQAAPSSRARPFAGSHGIRLALSKASLMAGLMATTAAQALTIGATFQGYDAAHQDEILTALSFYESTFSDNIALNLKFINTGTGLGTTNQFFYKVNYGSFLSALANDGSSSTDAIALANLPWAVPGDNAPVPGAGPKLIINRAGAAAVGLNVGDQSDGITSWDAVIDLNLSLMSTDHAHPELTPDLYDLRSIAMHEINEVLGSTSNLGRTGFFSGSVSAIDLFRYDLQGDRSFTTSGDDAYLSLDGVTQLARFNQDGGGDYGDFWSAGPHSFQLQDAFASPGVAADMGVEIDMLDAIGLTLAQVSTVPEPGSLALVVAALGLAASARRRKR